MTVDTRTAPAVHRVSATHSNRRRASQRRWTNLRTTQAAYFQAAKKPKEGK